MAVMFFGQYLVEKGVVSREVLLQAIELQESVNLSVGAVAISMGLLTEADVERINQAQRTEDLRFGDMASKLGLLNQEQFQQVLTKQKNNYHPVPTAGDRIGGLYPCQGKFSLAARIRPLPIRRQIIGLVCSLHR